MLATVKVLKRGDASSVIVAILLAFILSNPIANVTTRLANTLSGIDEGQAGAFNVPGADWKVTYLHPVVWALLQIIVLEVVIWAYVLAAGFFKAKRK